MQWVERRWRSTSSEPDRRVAFFGDDLEGIALEVLAAELEEEEFMVIHAMNLRGQHRVFYEEARPWEK